MNIPRIMIVEDETIVAADVRFSLERAGYQVCAMAVSGEDAIAKAQDTQPDLILMDISLQGELDGIQAAEAIHGQLSIPIIFLTAYADQDMLTRAKVSEPFGYLLKPFHPRELYTNIEMALYKAKMEAERKALHQENVRLIEELQAALAEVKTLQGFIPICSSCKKIRDDSGFWQQIEKYIQERSDAKFSHSICPDCAKKLYPDFWQEIFPDVK
jgi:CheY-like chemotaxis protein